MKNQDKFKKLLSKSIRPVGATLILVTCFICMLSSEFYAQAELGPITKWLLDGTISFENRFFDFRMRQKVDSHLLSKEIVLIEIDNYTLSELGQWPLNRKVYSDLLRKLTLFGAKTVAFDVLFPEKSPGEGPNSPDQLLVKAFKEFTTADRQAYIGYTILPPEAPEVEKLGDFPTELLENIINTKQVADSNLNPMAISSYNYPIPEIAESGVGLGYITMGADADGVFRNYFLVSNIDQFYVGSLALNAYQYWSGDKVNVDIATTEGGVEASLIKKDRKLEIDSLGRTMIRYWGGLQQFPHTSFYTVVNAKDTDEDMRAFFKDKLVFVGSTADGAHDLRHTPLDNNMPGVLAHVNIANMLIHGYFYKPKNESLTFSLILLFAGILVFIIIHRFDNPILDALTISALIAGSYYADQEYFIDNGYQLKLVYAWACFALTYSWNTFLNFYEANKEKRQIKNTFARYVAPTVVEEMLKDPEHIVVGGSKMDITCLFSDVRDFTSISEGLSAQDLANMLNEYMSAMTDIVFDTKGTLDKYIGDAIVAIWGAPIPIGNHAQHAAEAAVRMAETMPAINEEFKKRNLPFFNVGIGLNTGECSVGNMGSTRIFSYTALGDNMNLGARLEGLCKYYGAQILISEQTLERIDRSMFRVRPMDKVIVKGRTKPVQIFEIVSRVHKMSEKPQALQFYLTGHDFFTQKNFKGALEVFEQVLVEIPEDKNTKRLKILCEKYINDPSLVGEDFDVTKMTEK